MIGVKTATVMAAMLIVRVGAVAGPATTRASREVVFTERGSESSLSNVLRRIGWRIPEDARERDYDLKRETFVVRVPGGEDKGNAGVAPATRPYGIIAFVSSGETGQVPGAFDQVLEKDHLIWVAANRSGNKRAAWIRIGLALDGIHNIKARNPVDENRIYVAGLSGGGRISCFVSVCFPDVVRGGLAIIGADYFKQLPTGRHAGEYWPKAFDVPNTKLLAMAKKQSRFVMLEGDSDPNRFQAAAIAREMTKDGFKIVTYLEAPDVGHRLPDQEWVEKAVLTLDQGLADVSDGGGRGVADKKK